MRSFKIATWNVNSLRVRLPQVLNWLADAQPDVLALQETKLIDADFPIEAIQQAGYQVIFSGQKTYNGMAILSRRPATNIITGFPDYEDPQRRLLAAVIDDIRIVNLYIPNGDNIHSEKYQYKLAWLKQLDVFLKNELQGHSQIIVLGDFNIAPDDIDVHDPKQWAGKVLFSEPERNAFRDMLQVGFIDTFRQLNPAEKVFSWWDYRMNAFKRNVGLRIDHVLSSHALASQCVKCYIDKLPRTHERPSDHAPVIAEYHD
jgi:exodeoxyribonuclease-3